MMPRFFVERKGEQIRMIFPVPQRYEVKTYRVNKRRSYSRIEPVHTPWLSLPIGKETAKELAAALRANRVKGEVTIYDCDNWWMVVEGGQQWEAAYDFESLDGRYQHTAVTDEPGEYAMELARRWLVDADEVVYTVVA